MGCRKSSNDVYMRKEQRGEILESIDDMGVATTRHRGRMMVYWSCHGGNSSFNYQK